MKNLIYALVALAFFGSAAMAHPEVTSGRVQLTDGTAYVKTAILNQAQSTTGGSLVAAVTGKRILVLSACAVCGGTATNVTFLGNTTAISPLFALGVNGVLLLPMTEHGWFATGSGEALKVTTGSGSTTGVIVNYIEVQ